VALVLAVGLAYAWRGYLRRSDESSSSLRSAAQTVPVHAGRTALVILPFDYTSDSTRHPFLDGGLVSEIVGALAVHPGIAVIAPGTAAQVAMRGLTPPEIADLLAVDYVVRGDIRQEAQRVRVTVSMIEPRSSMIQLSKRYDGTLERVLDLQAEIARDLAGSVATGVTPSLVRRLPYAGTVDPEVLALYQEATSLRHPPSDPVRSRLAEDAYRRVIELDPDFAGGHAGLAFVLALRSWWGVSEQPETDVRRALEAARLAVEKEPDSGRARISLAIVLNVLGDRDGSLAAAQHAAILSPSDPYVLAFTGIFRAFAGEFDAAIPPARVAVRLDPLSARRPFRNMAGVVLYHAGRFEEAHEAMSENVRLGGPDGPHMACYRAAALARLGSMEEARAELAKAEEFPYEFDIRDFLSAFADPRDADELLDTLGSIAAGLDAPVTQKRAASRNTP
jgi:TolB-like protein/tetratricopeptide (TPR) repeat protein